MALQGAKHMIWESALKVATHNILTVKEGLNKKPMEVSQNAINFLSTL